MVCYESVGNTVLFLSHSWLGSDFKMLHLTNSNISRADQLPLPPNSVGISVCVLLPYLLKNLIKEIIKNLILKEMAEKELWVLDTKFLTI